MRQALLVASAVEAFFLLTLLGYGPLYLHLAFHADVFVSSLAAAGPALATFVGSTLWGHQVWRRGVRLVSAAGLAGYILMGLVVFWAPGPEAYIIGIMAATLLASALAPVTLTLLTHQGGDMGRRLATRMQWQSSGWVLGGLLAGYLDALSHRAFPSILMVLALMMVAVLAVVWRAPRVVLEAGGDEQAGAGPSLLGVTVLLVIPFFLAYAGNEGFFTNFSLYLHAVRVTPAWVGWSSAISTGLGWILAGRIGRWTDRIGGKKLLIGVLTMYAVMYLIMSLAASQAIVIVAFSLPLYPFLNIGIQRAVAESLPGHQHGGAMGLMNGASGLATFGGSLAMGAVNSLWGAPLIPWTAGVFVSAGLVAAAWIYRAQPFKRRAW